MLVDSHCSEGESQMSNDCIGQAQEHQSADMAMAFNILWLMRLVSALNLTLSGVACLAMNQKSHVVAATAFFISLIVTWSTPKVAAWLWGGTCVIGLVLMAFFLRVI